MANFVGSYTTCYKMLMKVFLKGEGHVKVRKGNPVFVRCPLMNEWTVNGFLSYDIFSHLKRSLKKQKALNILVSTSGTT